MKIPISLKNFIFFILFRSYSNDYVLLNKLNSSREDWKIKVRVCRLWDVRDYKDREKIISTEMVIADEEGNYMHAVIWNKFVVKYKDLLNEGSLLDGNHDSIPLHIFEFIPFGELKSRVRNDFLLTDIVGIVVSIGNVEQKNVNGSPINTLVIELQDFESQIIQLTLWDCYVDDFTKKLESTSGCGVVVVTSTIVKSFVGENRVVATNDFDAICSVPELLASIHGERDKDNDDAFLLEKLTKLAGSSYLFDVKLGTYAKSGGVHFFNVIGVLDRSSDCDVDLKNATVNNNEDSMLLFDCSKIDEEIATPVDSKKKTNVEKDDVSILDGVNSSSECNSTPPIRVFSNASYLECGRVSFFCGLRIDAEDIARPTSTDINVGTSKKSAVKGNRKRKNDSESEKSNSNQAHKKRKNDNRIGDVNALQGKEPIYQDLGPPLFRCSSCKALMWYEERADKPKKPKHPEFFLCCKRGKIELPKMKEPPEVLRRLMSYSGDVELFDDLDNKLVREELSYDLDLMKRIHVESFAMLNDDQLKIYYELNERTKS
ncbi:hypothetical protein REPUB_Repub08aG0087900 [Reevesia pubescens]